MQIQMQYIYKRTILSMCENTCFTNILHNTLICLVCPWALFIFIAKQTFFKLILLNYTNNFVKKKSYISVVRKVVRLVHWSPFSFPMIKNWKNGWREDTQGSMGNRFVKKIEKCSLVSSERGTQNWPVFLYVYYKLWGHQTNQLLV